MYYVKSCLAALLLVCVTGVAVAQDAPPREAKQTVARSEAVVALKKFQKDPLHNLEAAGTFTTYVKEDGAVHVSMSERLVPWMVDRSVPPRSKAILLSAFVAGNFQSYLDDKRNLDDTAAALTYTVEVYELLKKEDPTLMVAELDKLLAAKQDGELRAAIDDMIEPGQQATESTE